MRIDTPTPADLDEIQKLLSLSVNNILAHEDPQQYLDWLRAHGAAL